MALGRDYAAQDCSMARALEVVGERWTLLIVRDAFFGVRRFSDFQAHLDIPRAVLSARLSALVDGGVLARDDGEYALTRVGVELWPVLVTLAAWGVRHFSADGPSRVFVHAPCEARVGRDARCTECGSADPAEVEVHPGPGLAAQRRDDPVSRALDVPHRLLVPLAV